MKMEGEKKQNREYLNYENFGFQNLQKQKNKNKRTLIKESTKIQKELGKITP